MVILGGPVSGGPTSSNSASPSDSAGAAPLIHQLIYFCLPRPAPPAPRRLPITGLWSPAVAAVFNCFSPPKCPPEPLSPSLPPPAPSRWLRVGGRDSSSISALSLYRFICSLFLSLSSPSAGPASVIKPQGLLLLLIACGLGHLMRTEPLSQLPNTRSGIS